MKELTDDFKTMPDRHKAFCENLLEHNNITKAAKDAGFSEKTAAYQGSRLLKKVKIQAYLKKLKEERIEQNKVDAAWVVNKWMELIEICMASKPVMIKVDGEWVESGEYKVDAFGANKALENLAKHLGMFDGKGEKPPINNVIQNFVSGNGYKDKSDEEIRSELQRKVNTAFGGNRSGNRL